MNNTITNPINLILAILGVYLGIKLTYFLLKNQSQKQYANQFLSGFIFIQTLPFVIGMLYRFELLEYVPHLIGIQTLYQSLIGALIYFYVRACTQKEFKLTPILYLHFLPFIADVIISIPFFTLSGVEKLTAYEVFIQQGIIYSPPIWTLIKAIIAITYFLFSIRLILQYRVHLGNATSTIDKSFHRWLLFFIFLSALPIIVSIIFVVAEYDRTYTISIFLIGITTLMFLVDMATLYKPELFHIFPHQMLIPQSTEDKKQKYESSNLQEQQKEKYVKTLQTYVQEQKPHLHPDLSLAQLSEQINIPTNHLSQVINEKLHCNFLDFINSLRIEEAKNILSDSKYSHYTIIAAAYEAGFSAKSTFYSAFKKHTGMTPSQFRKQAKVAM